MLLSRALRQTAGAISCRARIPQAAGGTYPTDNSFVLHFDTIPNLAKNTTIRSVQSGNWSTAATWNLGRIPAQDDIIGICKEHTVTYDLDATTAFKAVGVAGLLTFVTNANTKLWTQHGFVYSGGELRIGTAATPVEPAFTADVVIRNVAIDVGTLGALGADPAAFGNGIVCLSGGKVRMHGAIKTPFKRTAAEPLATDTDFALDGAVTGWRVGDTIVCPDSRELGTAGGWGPSYEPHWESRTIDSLTAGDTVVNFTGGLAYDHPCARLETGTIDRYPYVINLTRNVKIRSELGTGVRGHTFYTDRADVDIRYVEHYQLGRTSIADINSFVNRSPSSAFYAGSLVRLQFSTPHLIGHGDTVRTSGFSGATNINGDFTVSVVDLISFDLVGTGDGSGTYTGGTVLHMANGNQIGRYAIHLHHLYGPVSIPASGYQFVVKGCTIHDPLPAVPSISMPASKWGLACHDSHYGLIEDNIVHHYAGAGFVTEEGNETEVLFNRNFASSMIGNGSQRDVTPTTFGRAGAGFAHQGLNSRHTNNVAAGNHSVVNQLGSGIGFYYVGGEPTGEPGGNTPFPDFQGATTHEVGDFTNHNKRDYYPSWQNSGNESYCTAAGMIIWWMGSSGYNHTATASATISGFVTWANYQMGWFGYPCDKMIFDGWIIRGVGDTDQTFGITWGDYWASDITIRNCNIQGVGIGVGQITSLHTFCTIEDSYFNCPFSDIRINLQSSPGNGTPLENHVFNIDNCVCDQWGAEASFWKIEMHYSLGFSKTNLTVRHEVHVTDFDGNLGANYDLYFHEAARDAIMPQNGFTSDLIASPVAGDTNEENYVNYNQDQSAKTGGSTSDPTGLCTGGILPPLTVTSGNSIGIYGLIEEVSAVRLSMGEV